MGDGREEEASRTDLCLRAIPLQEEREAPLLAEADRCVRGTAASASTSAVASTSTAGAATARGTAGASASAGAVGGRRDDAAAAAAAALDEPSIANAIDEDEVDIAFTCAGDRGGDDADPDRAAARADAVLGGTEAPVPPTPLRMGPCALRDCCCCFPPPAILAAKAPLPSVPGRPFTGPRV